MECGEINNETTFEESNSSLKDDSDDPTKSNQTEVGLTDPLENSCTAVAKNEVDETSNSLANNKVADNTDSQNGDNSAPKVTTEVKTPGRPGRKRRGEIYDKNDDPETIKEKKKKRAVELKLKNLKCTFNETSEVSGKRQKKAPQRFELVPVDKRKSLVDNSKGRGEPLGNISWISHQLRAASLYTLRLLHRLIYRKQGMFSEKHIRKSVMKFSGFPFDAGHPEVKRRREQLERLNANALHHLSHLLGLRPGSPAEMIDRIIDFLLCPSHQVVDEYVMEMMSAKLQQPKLLGKPFENAFQQQESLDASFFLHQAFQDDNFKTTSHEDIESPCAFDPGFPISVQHHIEDIINAPWKKPIFFSEGSGVKLKYIRAVTANIEAASDAFIELLHRLLYLDVDEKHNMRRNILEFSGMKCDVGSANYIYRMRVLSVLPMDQIKLICRVLCLPTWHRSRQFLTEGIMDFLAVPRISAMKKRVPPLFSEEITFSFDNAKANKVKLPELKSVETEEIEIVPDIHIPDETSILSEGDLTMENEYLGIKLKNFSNIHYQVISTPAAKLSDVHMILYLTTSAQNNIRRNVLEFSGFPFDDSSPEYQCRRTLMEQMSLEDLKTVAIVLCVSQYIVDESKNSIIEAVLKFLLKPSALLNSSTMMPTISQAPVSRKSSVVKKRATSTVKSPQSADVKPDIVISKVVSLSDSKEAVGPSVVDSKLATNCSNSQAAEDVKPELEKMKACLSDSIEITPVPQGSCKKEIPTPVQSICKKEIITVPPPAAPPEVVIKDNSVPPCSAKEVPVETDEPLSKVKKSVAVVTSRVSYFGSDDEDDQPLSKMIGHPNDDQLRILVNKIIKESKLEDITMKHVIQRVFETYPNFDLGYRKEFIKSTVRHILSQMDEQNCSVSTTVITI